MSAGQGQWGRSPGASVSDFCPHGQITNLCTWCSGFPTKEKRLQSLEAFVEWAGPKIATLEQAAKVAFFEKNTEGPFDGTLTPPLWDNFCAAPELQNWGPEFLGPYIDQWLQVQDPEAFVD